MIESEATSSVVIITGPTASGKTDLSLRLAEKLHGEIINADVGQFYTACSIGTAKPDWQNQTIPHHLFDIISEPQDLSVSTYRKLVLKTIADIQQRNKTPIIVGGSLFYLKSLFFPPSEHVTTSLQTKLDGNISWDTLNKIDPQRAAKLHPNDTYRITRALQVWQATGSEPSKYEPQFLPPFSATLYVLTPPRELLFERINLRTTLMMSKSPNWIDEVQKLRGTEWEAFLKRKKLIGYEELFSWLNMKKTDDKSMLIAAIQKATRRYAKRQMTFWNGFKKQLLQQKNIFDWLHIEECESADEVV